jgi:hypothetical protein
VLAFGPGIRGGNAFGVTGRETEGKPISLRTGRPSGSAGDSFINLNDLGATLLRLCGIDPERHGYEGRQLSFLVDA